MRIAGWDMINLPDSVLAGLAVCSHEPGLVCQAQFDKLQVSPVAETILPAGDGDGLVGVYYDSATGKAMGTRLDTAIAFDWEVNSPGMGLPDDLFSIRWTGALEVPVSDSYTFHLLADDGARLWLNNSLLIEAWKDQPTTAHASLPVELKAGQKYLLRLEYYEKKLHAAIKLAWSSASIPVQIIPQSQLFSHVTDTDQDGLPDDWEILYALDPLGATDAAQDPDGDGLTNEQEFQAGAHPLQTDSDSDGMPDRWEFQNRLRAYDPQDALNDLDHDGVNNLVECQRGTNPLNPDSDGDGFSDGREIQETKTDPLQIQSQTAIALAFTTTPEQADIGLVGLKGSSSYDAANGIYTVAGAGSDIWNFADAFHFAYQPLFGDGQLVARVLDIAHTDDWAKAGLMIRDSLAPVARHALITLTPGFGAAFQRRVNPDGRSVSESLSAALIPGWLKLVRQGNLLRGYYSADGYHWELAGWDAIELPSQVWIGLAVCSHDQNALCQALFDQVALTLLPNQAAPLGDGDGLLGTYYETPTGKVVETRIDPLIGFDWENNSPFSGIGPDNFSIRWTGEVSAPSSEPYTFHLLCDDGARLWLDNRLLIDAWEDHPSTAFSSLAVELKAGQRHVLKLEYYEKVGQAVIKLAWSSPSIPVQIIPFGRLYSKIIDTDRDGLPDDWENTHGLNPQDPTDASADPDNDRLTNAEEYAAGSDPRVSDTDADGMPDCWEVAHGLRTYDSSDATHDLDADGLTNLEEFQQETNPRNADTDADGLPDGMEVHETGTNPLASDIQGIVNVMTVSGAQAVSRLGAWGIDGTAIYAKDWRGAVEYALNVPAADMYRIEIEGRERSFSQPPIEMPLLISIEDEFLGRVNLVHGARSNGLAHCFTPWLLPGDHRLRIYWDNTKAYKSLLIQAVRLQALLATDANGNGIKDWVEQRLKTQNGVELAGQGDAPSLIYSPVSPFCLEGRGAYLSMLQLATGQISLDSKTGLASAVLMASGLRPQPGAGKRWYVNVPLAADQATVVAASFQNGGLKQTNQIIWQPINLLESSDLTIRQGDSLRLAVLPPEQAGLGVQAQIEIVGVTNYLTKLKEPVVHCFDQTGRFTLRASIANDKNKFSSRSLTVTVLSASFDGKPACAVGKPYVWDCPNLPGNAVVESDQRLQFEQLAFLAGGGRRFRLTIDAPEPRYVVARLGTNGPVMANARIEGFNLFSGDAVEVRLAERLSDGSQIVEMAMILSGVPLDILIRIEIFVGGITFEDGTIVKELTATDFDNLGQCTVRFIRPATAQTSICHRTKVYQAGVLIGEF